ncbi:RNA-directed DNA polymerase from mobile element jockey isoform X2 [Pristis pectinata]|uniref:RNA-directed DNA polymerase from mobile element jockey isoform X2 n=1 Tax=Pristis pectinata TaxID=685728 RepID=UPI00223DD22A|nr:RNA-directed DNA polymerase from mobile element jockey isoform X2 [Pristis pectinata]
MGRVAKWVENWLVGRKQRVEIKGSRSGWLPVTSGVPQGSVLGPLLFTLYINDLDDGINGCVAKFADDTKISGGVGSIEEIERMQRDLDSLGEWARKWQMRFNVEKCAVVHFGSRNKRVDYYLEGEKIDSAVVQRDLGVLVQDTLKVNHQVGSVVKKANAMLAFISRGIVYKSKDVLMRLYAALVRPHLEYCVQFWAPHLRKDVLTLERVQRRFTRMIPGMKGLKYDERLSALGLYSLEYRRMRGDLVATFKMLTGKDRVDVARLFPLVGVSRTRGHNLRIRGYSFKTEMRRSFFTQRVVKLWNSLPRTAVEARSVGVFKEEIDRYLNSQGIKGYGDKAGKWD